MKLPRNKFVPSNINEEFPIQMEITVNALNQKDLNFSIRMTKYLALASRNSVVISLE